MILKEFLQHFVARIYVDRGSVSSITYKNDFTLHFIISNPFKNFTELFDSRLRKKNGSSIQHDATTVFLIDSFKTDYINRVLINFGLKSCYQQPSL